MSTFAFDNCFVAFNGRLITGFGEGTVVNINTKSDDWEHRKMVDGHVVSAKNLDESAKVEVILRWNSVSNNILEVERMLRTTGVLVVMLPDGTMFSGPRSRINKRPSPSFGQDASDMTWEFFCERLNAKWSTGEF